MSFPLNGHKRPFNLKRFAQRQEGVPTTFQPDRRPDPYRRPDKNKGEGKDLLRPGGEGSILGPPDMSSNSLGQTQRFSPLGEPFVGVSQFEDPADKNNDGENRLPEESLEGSPNDLSSGAEGQQGYGQGTETGHGLKGVGDDIGSGTGNVAGTAGSTSPLGVHDTIAREMNGVADNKVPTNNMTNTNFLGKVEPFNNKKQVGDVWKEVKQRVK